MAVSSLDNHKKKKKKNVDKATCHDLHENTSGCASYIMNFLSDALGALSVTLTRPTCCSTSRLGVSGDDPWVTKATEVQAISVVVVLLQQKGTIYRYLFKRCQYCLIQRQL